MLEPSQTGRSGSASRWWYYAPWEMTHWWKVTTFRGGDELYRPTRAVQLGPLGCWVFVTGPPRWSPELASWRAYRDAVIEAGGKDPGPIHPDEASEIYGADALSRQQKP